MAANKFVICGPDGPTRAKRLQPQEWAAHQQTVTDLYVHQNKNLDDLMAIMASKHGLIAKYCSTLPGMNAPCLLRICSRRQYTEKLRQWKVQKNLPGKVMRSAVCKLHQNPGRSDFTYMTQPISEQRMIRYQQRHPSLDPEASPAPCKSCPLTFLLRKLSDVSDTATPSQLDWESELESVSSPTEGNSLDRIEEAVSSDLRADMMELSISSNFSSTANTGTAHHMNGRQQFKATSMPALTADIGGNAAKREEADSEGVAALQYFTVGVIDEATLEKENTVFPSRPANQTNDAGERTEESRYLDTIADDAVKIGLHSSKPAKGNSDHPQPIFPEPPRGLGFGDAILREGAPYAKFAMLPASDRGFLETWCAMVAAAKLNDVCTQPQRKPKCSVILFWYCCACKWGPYLVATNPACPILECAHRRCNQCKSKRCSRILVIGEL